MTQFWVHAAITKRDIGMRSRHSQTRSSMGGPGSAGANDSPFIVPLGDCDFAADRVLEGMIPEAPKPVRLSWCICLTYLSSVLSCLLTGCHLWGHQTMLGSVARESSTQGVLLLSRL